MNQENITKEIWEKRRDLLQKARENKLSFSEFSMLEMHKETKGLLNPSGGLSEKGLATLSSIKMYLKGS